MIITDKAQSLLKSVFGYDQFISLQADIIENVLQKKDTLVIMPTGGGKSLCYQIPALIFKGLTIVVSPLISLMKDQVEQLRQRGIAAVFLNSSLPPDEYRQNVDRIRKEQVQLLYLAPETLLKPNFLQMLSSVRVECMAIDEAHCISAWGHDFRPEYRQLAGIRARFQAAVCIALTATATPRVRQDIKTNLGMDNSAEFIASFNRENLFLQVISKEDPVNQATQFIQNHPDQSGIIYCFSRRQVDDLYAHFNGLGYSIRPYHAGLTEAERTRNQELFIRDEVQMIIATIAFGMGIDKENIRFVLHYDLPQNMEGYYQEVGRAGRDGLRSDCLLLFGYGDIRKIKHFIDKKTDHEKRVANIHLNALLRFVETDECRRIPLINYFGEKYSSKNCQMCDNCLTGKKAQKDITLLAQKFLSCVRRTGETFGATHIVDVLRGSKSQKVFKFGHQHLSTYGIGMECSKKQWIKLSRQFINKGLLTQDTEYGSLKLTEKGWAVLKAKQSVLGRLAEENIPKLSPEVRAPSYDGELFEILRIKRKELADAAHVPPYIVFSDKTLIEMASRYPRNRQAFMDIHGVGKVKYENYGPIYMEIIREYCRRHNIEDH
ncbi:MAG: DNA helicase RecQ [Desulfobacterales bacterium]|jgi:ATP-dependent DNA helicase RecQ